MIPDDLLAEVNRVPSPRSVSGPLVYIAGPLGSDPSEGVRQAVAAHVQLLDAGIPSIVPHLSHFTDLMFPRPYETWIDLDLALVERCDWLLRLEGDSPGADREMAHAESLGISVWQMTGCAGMSVERFISLITGELVEVVSVAEPGRCATCDHLWSDHGVYNGETKCRRNGCDCLTGAATIPIDDGLVIRGDVCVCGHHLNQHNGALIDPNGTTVKAGYCVGCECPRFSSRPQIPAGRTELVPRG